MLSRPTWYVRLSANCKAARDSPDATLPAKVTWSHKYNPTRMWAASPPTLQVITIFAPPRRAGAERKQCYRRFDPYFDLACFLFSTPCKSNLPRTSLYLTPGKSLTRPPRTSTTECSCKLCLSPGMWAMTSVKFVKRILATLRKAELGFLGVVV